MAAENDARYPPNPYGMSQDYASSHRQKAVARNMDEDHYVEDDDSAGEDVEVQEIDDEDDVEEEEEEEEEEVREVEENDGGDDDDDDDDDENAENGVRRTGSGEFEAENDDGDDDDEDDDEDDDDDGDDGDLQRHPKKRKLKSLLSSYEFAPRVPAPKPLGPPAPPPMPKMTGRNSLADWTEQETFALLASWGEKFLRHKRKSLRSEEWHDVAERVTKETKIERTDTQCRNRLDTLKKKYKKEKAKYGESGFFASKWIYYQKMDVLLSGPIQKQKQQQSSRLSCGVDSGEYVFTKDGKRSNNGALGMRDSPEVSESADDGEDDDSGGPPAKWKKNERRGNEVAAPFKVLADSIHKFSSIYEKIETSKRQQIMELEKMRMDLHRDMELQKRQILEKAQAEIVKIRRGDVEENNNMST